MYVSLSCRDVISTAQQLCLTPAALLCMVNVRSFPCGAHTSRWSLFVTEGVGAKQTIREKFLTLHSVLLFSL